MLAKRSDENYRRDQFASVSLKSARSSRPASLHIRTGEAGRSLAIDPYDALSESLPKPESSVRAQLELGHRSESELYMLLGRKDASLTDAERMSFDCSFTSRSRSRILLDHLGLTFFN